MRLALVCSIALAASAQPALVRVDTTPAHILNSFDPDRSLGTSIDVLSRSDIDQVYSPHILQESLSAGWGPITYRNNSELRMAAWHWTENGAWSDAAHKNGYFTGSTELKEPTRYILSYSLPHRGFSYSADRPIQGPTVYWKSNPYLTSHFTGESDALHPQWVVVDLKSPKAIQSVRIEWAAPYATVYQVEYWKGDGSALDFDSGPKGAWIAPLAAKVAHGAGGAVDIPLAATTQFVRVLMSASSNTCDLHGSADIRNCVGYAIQNITVDGQPGALYTTSSIDPWHDAADARSGGAAQHTGFDLFFTSGITNNLPAMIPVTLLYGTPEDSAAQIAYIQKRGYPVSYIEMGEEPDGKHAMPEDYGALYIQWADAIHKVDPSAKLGGPVFEGVNEDITVWPDAEGRKSWLGRFIHYLTAHGHLRDLAFVSFEHYPFDRCGVTWKSLYEEPKLVKHILDVWRADGVPKDVPLMITESHMAAQLTGPMSTIEAALWLADNAGAFFEAGGAAFYHSPIQPQGVQNSCLGWATWSNFVSGRDYAIRGYTSLYWAARMLNVEWAQHRSGVHRMFPAKVNLSDANGNQLVTTYALQRPDGNWSILLVNRDEHTAHTVRVSFEDSSTKKTESFVGQVTRVTFGREQYEWHSEGATSHPDPDAVPAGAQVPGGPHAVYILPAASLTVLRGKVR